MKASFLENYKPEECWRFPTGRQPQLPGSPESSESCRLLSLAKCSGTQNVWILMSSRVRELAQQGGRNLDLPGSHCKLGQLGGTAPPPGVKGFPPGDVLLCVTLAVPQVLACPQMYLLHQGASEVVAQGDDAEGQLPPPADILLLKILQVDHGLSAYHSLLGVHRRDPGMSESLLDGKPFPGLFHKKLPNEVLGQLACLEVMTPMLHMSASSPSGS